MNTKSPNLNASIPRSNNVSCSEPSMASVQFNKLRVLDLLSFLDVMEGHLLCVLNHVSSEQSCVLCCSSWSSALCSEGGLGDLEVAKAGRQEKRRYQRRKSVWHTYLLHQSDQPQKGAFSSSRDNLWKASIPTQHLGGCKLTLAVAASVFWPRCA